MNGLQKDSVTIKPLETHLYSGSDTIRPGYAMCFDTSKSSANDREKYVTKPSWSNLVSRNAFAGVVDSLGPVTAAGRQINLIPWDGRMYRNVNVYTDENVAAGDLLAPIPDSYYFGRAVVVDPVFEAWAASDRSVTAGLVNGCVGRVNDNLTISRISRHVDHFRAPNVDKVVANVATGTAGHYLLNGTTAVASLATNGSTPAGTGIGELSVVGTTTTIGQIQQAGAQWKATAGRSIFCRQRVKIDDISDEDWFFGLGTPPTVSAGVLTAVPQVTSAGTAPAGTDYMGFFFDATGGTNTNLNFNIRKASGTQQYVSMGLAFVNDTYIDLAFLARNRLTGTTAGYKTVQVYVNGTLITTFNSATQAAAFPDTVPLAWAMSGITGGCVGTIDYLYIAQNH